MTLLSLLLSGLTSEQFYLNACIFIILRLWNVVIWSPTKSILYNVFVVIAACLSVVLVAVIVDPAKPAS